MGEDIENIEREDKEFDMTEKGEAVERCLERVRWPKLNQVVAHQDGTLD